MRFHDAGLAGAVLIEPEPIGDERGSFARIFCERAFAERGLETRFVQHSRSHSRHRHTLRGLHFQKPPHQEVKLVSCVGGAILDVIVDMRPASPTFRRWRAFELSAANGHELYIPKGFAHGFQALTDDAMVNYLISAFYEPSAASGLRHDDPALGIDWPAAPTVMSEKDRAWPLLQPLEPIGASAG